MGGGSAAAQTGKTKMTKPFRNLPAKGETKVQAILRNAEFSRFGALAPLFIGEAMQSVFGPFEFAGRETLDAKLKQALKFAPARAVKAVEDYAGHFAALTVEQVREDFAKAGNGLIHPDSWHGVAKEIKANLDAAKA